MKELSYGDAERAAGIEPVEIAELHILRTGERKCKVLDREYEVIETESGFTGHIVKGDESAVAFGRTITDALLEADAIANSVFVPNHLP